MEIRAEVVEKRVDVNQVELAERVRKRVEKTLKRRYTWIGVLTIFLTGGGVLLVQASTLSVNREVIVEWRISARESQKRLERIDSAVTKLAGFEQSLAEYKRMTDDLNQSFSALTEDAEDARGTLKNIESRAKTTCELISETS